MPVYTPIIRRDLLPQVGRGFATDVFDTKSQCHAAAEVAIAKDLAAFAKNMGATLLVGAHVDKAVIAKYAGVTPNNAHRSIARLAMPPQTIVLFGGLFRRDTQVRRPQVLHEPGR